MLTLPLRKHTPIWLLMCIMSQSPPGFHLKDPIGPCRKSIRQDSFPFSLITLTRNTCNSEGHTDLDNNTVGLHTCCHAEKHLGCPENNYNAYNAYHLSFFIENGPCLGSRKPKQPYQWLSYKEVRFIRYFLVLMEQTEGCVCPKKKILIKEATLCSWDKLC